VPGVFRIASSDYFTTIAGLVSQGYDTGLPLASTTNVALLNRQRTSLQDIREELIAARENWDAFVSESGIPEARVGNVEEGIPYADRLVSLLERYELDVAVQTAQIETTAAERSLAGYRSTVSRARSALEEENASGIARPRTDTARQLLQPLVGTVSGIRVISTASGDLAELANEGTSLATRLQNEVPYVRTDGTIQSLASRATRVATSVTAPATGLLPEARSLLEQALEQIDRAEALAAEADQRVADARRLLEQAADDAAAGDILSASQVLGDVEDLLQADARSASRLISQSLQNWYRPDIESRWSADQEELLAARQEILVSIVFVRVDVLISDAAELIEPAGLTEPQPRLAQVQLDEAAALLAEVSPGALNPEIEALRRRAELLLLGSSRTLEETAPDYTRWSQTLNQARTAYSNDDYETATAFLTNFLAEQPNNEQGRILQVRIALADSADSNLSTDAIVRNFVNRVIDEATPIENDAATIRQFLQNADSTLAGQGYDTGDFFELQTRLDALRRAIEEDDISISSTRQREIDTLIAQIELKLNPPPPTIVLGLSPAEQARELVDQHIGKQYDTLPVSQLEDIRDDLITAISLDPQNAEARRQLQLVLIQIPPEGIDPDTQGILDQASTLIADGNRDGALALLEGYEARNPSVVRYPEFTELRDDLRRSVGGR
jgi:hypothetical protein